MEIIINKIDPILVKEDYSEYEKDDVISVISDVCKYVDEFCIADFVAIFAFWDKRFSDLDFFYDFTSIVDELSSLQLFLESKVGSFLLHFYELDRRVALQPPK